MRASACECVRVRACVCACKRVRGCVCVCVCACVLVEGSHALRTTRRGWWQRCWPICDQWRRSTSFCCATKRATTGSPSACLCCARVCCVCASYSKCAHAVIPQTHPSSGFSSSVPPLSSAAAAAAAASSGLPLPAPSAARLLPEDDDDVPRGPARVARVTTCSPPPPPPPPTTTTRWRRSRGECTTDWVRKSKRTKQRTRNDNNNNVTISITMITMTEKNRQTTSKHVRAHALLPSAAAEEEAAAAARARRSTCGRGAVDVGMMSMGLPCFARIFSSNSRALGTST